MIVHLKDFRMICCMDIAAAGKFGNFLTQRRYKPIFGSDYFGRETVEHINEFCGDIVHHRLWLQGGSGSAGE